MQEIGGGGEGGFALPFKKSVKKQIFSFIWSFEDFPGLPNSASRPMFVCRGLGSPPPPLLLNLGPS